MNLSDETIDGFLFENKLLSMDHIFKPKREKYFKSINDDKRYLNNIDRKKLENAAIQMKLITIPGRVETIELNILIDKIAHSMQSKTRNKWLELLENNNAVS